MTAVRPEGRHQSGAGPQGGAASPDDPRGAQEGSQGPAGGLGGAGGPGRQDDAWGVYEEAGQDELPEYPWLADQTLQLRVPPPPAEPVPTGGRAERRRAAQGRTALRSGGGRLRARG
ncbi:hypothetical protein ACWEQL_40730, partial [Kitasatospora sp. NPDC004240]